MGKALKLAPFYDPERDGVTYSLLAKFKSCREFTRLALQGWTGKFPSFALAFGGLFHHILQQAYERVLIHHDRTVPSEQDVVRWLAETARIWYRENPTKNDTAVQIFEEALLKAGAILPAYFSYWKADFTTRAWMDVENEFRLPFEVVFPSLERRTVMLRGKIDGLFTTPKAKKNPKAARVFETKTRSHIDENELVDTMPHNLQTAIYLLAAEQLTGRIPVEVEMNLVRKFQLRQGKAESLETYERRLKTDVAARPDWYFIRMSMAVDKDDVARMREEINQLIADFLMWWYGDVGHYKNDQACYLFHRPCDMIRICSQNDTSGVFKRKAVFSELEDL